MRYGRGSDWGKFREFRKLRELRFFSPNVLNFLNRPQAAQLSQQAAGRSTPSTLYSQIQLLQLLIINARWGIQHNVSSRIIFRESDEVANTFTAA
jgi:hypothetical protein